MGRSVDVIFHVFFTYWIAIADAYYLSKAACFITRILGIMALPAYICLICADLFTTPVKSQNPISLLLSESGLEFTQSRQSILYGASRACRLCRLLKDFDDQAEGAKLRTEERFRNRKSSGATIPSPQNDMLRLRFQLSRNHFSISAPNNVFAGTLQFRPTTDAGRTLKLLGSLRNSVFTH